MRRRFKQSLAALLVRTGLLALLRLVRVGVLRRPKLLILCYHRVTEDSLVFSPLAVSRSGLDAQLKALRSCFRVLSPGEVREHLAPKPGAGDAVVVTFDDGYLDNFTDAAPVLEENGISGVFYISAAPLLRGEAYWLDLLGEAVERALPSPEAENSGAQWLGASLLEELRRCEPSQRPALLRPFLSRLMNSHSGAPGDLLRKLRIPDTQVGSRRAIMSCDQALELQRRGHVIGAHTVTHPRLSWLSEADCAGEVQTSIDLFRQAGFLIDSFAYPFGKAEDIGPVAPGVVARSGVSMAFTTADRPVHADDDLFAIPRIVVGDQSPELLLLRLEKLCWRELFPRRHRTEPSRAKLACASQPLRGGAVS